MVAVGQPSVEYVELQKRLDRAESAAAEKDEQIKRMEKEMRAVNWSREEDDAGENLEAAEQLVAVQVRCRNKRGRRVSNQEGQEAGNGSAAKKKKVS